VTSDPTAQPASAWFGGRLATGLADLVRADAGAAASDALRHAERSGGWWAVVAEYEGPLTLARFDEVRAQPLPPAERSWPGVPRDAWTTSMTRERYLEACTEVRERIARGEVYQANVCRVLEAPLPDDADLLALAAGVQRCNPAPYAGFVRLPDAEVVCASPELFLERSGRRVTTGPIKGTATDEARLLPKDVHENVMIVDLARNDLSTVCVAGSVSVPDLLTVESHPGLVHLVSRVSGELRDDAGWPELWAATTPAASVTGAPKSSALKAIADLEPTARGPYCGAIGWLDADRQQARLAVGIRTFWSARAMTGQRVLRYGTGAGITWGSVPEQEWEETELKAVTLLGVAAGPAGGTPPL
jgi:para-aminobenzoate synthetase component 1